MKRLKCVCIIRDEETIPRLKRNNVKLLDKFALGHGVRSNPLCIIKLNVS